MILWLRLQLHAGAAGGAGGGFRMIRRPVWSGAGAADRSHREWVGLEVPMRSFSVLYWPDSKVQAGNVSVS